MLSPGKQDSQKATDADLIAGEIYIYTNTILLSINHKQSKPGTAVPFLEPWLLDPKSLQ